MSEAALATRLRARLDQLDRAHVPLTPALWLIAAALAGDERLADPEHKRNVEEAWRAELASFVETARGMPIEERIAAEGLADPVAGTSADARAWLAFLDAEAKLPASGVRLRVAASDALALSDGWADAQRVLFAAAERGDVHISARLDPTKPRQLVQQSYFAEPRFYDAGCDQIVLALLSTADVFDDDAGDAERRHRPMVQQADLGRLLGGLAQANARVAGAATAAGEHECRAWLASLMRAAPSARTKAKSTYAAEAMRKFEGRVSQRGFDRAWRDAINETGAAWGNPGRPTKSSH